MLNKKFGWLNSLIIKKFLEKIKKSIKKNDIFSYKNLSLNKKNDKKINFLKKLFNIFFWLKSIRNPSLKIL